MRKQKQIKQIISRPVRVLNRNQKSTVVMAKVLHKKGERFERKAVSRFQDFSLEAEAARLAYRNGMSTESGELYRVQHDPDRDSDDELEPTTEDTGEREVLIGGDRDELIEKLRKRIHSEEKEGWEAFYN